MELKEQIINDISNNKIMVFIKGTKEMPMCGFSATVVNILNMYNLDYEFTNVLEDPNIRLKLSEFSNWPTIPQLYIKEEFIGGCDIIKEMYESGELLELFSSKGIDVKPS